MWNKVVWFIVLTETKFAMEFTNPKPNYLMPWMGCMRWHPFSSFYHVALIPMAYSYEDSMQEESLDKRNALAWCRLFGSPRWKTMAKRSGLWNWALHDTREFGTVIVRFEVLFLHNLDLDDWRTKAMEMTLHSLSIWTSLSIEVVTSNVNQHTEYFFCARWSRDSAVILLKHKDPFAKGSKFLINHFKVSHY